MTKDEALRLALEVLEELNETNSYWWQEVDEVTTKKIDPAITAIKAALEAKDEPYSFEAAMYSNDRVKIDPVTGNVGIGTPQQEAKDEPVAWQYRDANDDGTWTAWNGCDKRLTESDWRKVRPLYTSPPQRKPLTDEEIGAILEGVNAYGTRLYTFARAIEAAHGIKE